MENTGILNENPAYPQVTKGNKENMVNILKLDLYCIVCLLTVYIIVENHIDIT